MGKEDIEEIIVVNYPLMPKRYVQQIAQEIIDKIGRGVKWKDKSCEDCRFRVDEFCRRFPPTIQNRGYLQIRQGQFRYQRACSEHIAIIKEKHHKTKEERG
jgi:hypothetical protein